MLIQVPAKFIKTLSPAAKFFKTGRFAPLVPQTLLRTRCGEKRSKMVFPVHSPTDPGFYWSSAPRRCHKTDGNCQILLQFTPEKISAGGKTSGTLRIADPPGNSFRSIPDRSVRSNPFGRHGIVKPEQRIIRMLQFIFRICGPPIRIVRKERHFHIGLTGTHPDITN